MIQSACLDMKHTAVIMGMHVLYCTIIIHYCIVIGILEVFFYICTCVYTNLLLN